VTNSRTQASASGFEQRGVLANALQIQRGDDPLAITEVVIEAADAGAGAITNHLDGRRLDTEFGETGERGLKDFLLAATAGHPASRLTRIFF